MTNPEALLAHAGFVRSVARSLVPDESRVDDIVQETWLAALEHPPRHRRSIRAWLATIALNVARSSLRSEGRRTRREQRAARPEGLPSTVDLADAKSMIRLVIDAVCSLDEPYASTVILRFYEDLTPGEIASRQGIPVETVRTRLKRANHRMRKYLDGRFRGHRRAWCLSLAPLVAPASSPEAALAEGAGTGGGSAALIGWAAVVVVAALLALLAFRLTGEGLRPVDPDRASLPRRSLPAARDARAPVAPESSAPLAAAVEAPSAEGSTGSLEIHVFFEETGEPAPGVRAAVGGADLVDAMAMSLDRVTDPEGRILVEDLPAGTAIVHVDRLFGFGHTEIRAGERSLLRLPIPPGLDLAGRVEDASGDPVAGAWIYLTQGSWDSGAIVAETDAEGRYLVRDVTSGGFLGARARGYLPGPLRPIAVMTEGEVTLDFRLDRASCTLAGTVLAAEGIPSDGAPLPGALVTVESSRPLEGESLADAPPRGAPPIRVTTGEDGSFEIDELAPGLARVRVDAPGHAAHIREVDLSERRFVALDVRLGRGATLRGTVLDASGRPEAGARIRARVPGDRVARGAIVESGPDGTYEVGNLVHGLVEVLVDGLEGRGSATRRFEVLEEKSIEWNPVLDPGLVIAGTVVDAQGAPLPGCDVFAGIPEFDLDRYHLDPTMHDFSWLGRHGGREGYFEIGQLEEAMLRRFRKRAVTDERGRFRISNLEERSYPIEVYLPCQATNRPSVAIDGVRPGGADLLLRVGEDRRPTTHVRGRLVDRRGDGVAAELTLRSPPKHYWRTPARTRADGTFRIGPLPRARYRLLVRADGGGKFVAGEADTSAGDVDLGEIVVEPAGTLEVELSRADGEPLRTPRVWLFDETRTVRLSARLVGDTVHAQELAPGRYFLCVMGRGSSKLAWTELPVDVRSGRHERESFEIRAGVPRTIRLLAAPGHRTIPGRVDLDVLDEHGARICGRGFKRSMRSSLVVQLALPAGDYALRFETEGGLVGRETVSFDDRAPDEPVDIRLRDPAER